MEISIARKRWWIAALALVASLAVSGSLPGRAGESEELTSMAPDATLERFAGTSPERCVFAAPGRRICRWEIQARLFAAGLDDGSDVTRRIHLICELSLDPQASGDAACRTHPQDAGLLPPVAAAGPDDSGAHGLETLRPARTLADLSHALGDVPDRCHTRAAQQTCIWLLRPGSSGYERFGAGIQGVPLLLRCDLPLNGLPRGAGSCTTARLPG